VTVLPGVRIGSHALVGAGSIVTRSVPANITVRGKDYAKEVVKENTNA
jgi:acetyltransferase-like isoleucine patch superfamily enzyme